MTIYFADDFENANFNKWAVIYGTPYIIAFNPHNGNYACQCIGTGTYLLGDLGADYNDIYVSMFLYFDSYPVSGNSLTFLGLADSSWTYGAGFYVNSNGHIYAQIDSGNDTDTGIVIPTGTYFWFQCEINSISGYMRVWLNNSLLWTGLTPVNGKRYIECGDTYETGGSSTIYLDDIVVASSYVGATSHNVTLTDYLGYLDSRIKRKSKLKSSTSNLIGMLDSRSKFKQRPHLVSDYSGLKETPSKLKKMMRSFAGLLGNLDFIESIIATKHRVITELEGLLDSKTRTKTLYRTYNELIGVKDYLANKIRLLFKIFSEILSPYG